MRGAAKCLRRAAQGGPTEPAGLSPPLRCERAHGPPSKTNPRFSSHQVCILCWSHEHNPQRILPFPSCLLPLRRPAATSSKLLPSCLLRIGRVRIPVCLNCPARFRRAGEGRNKPCQGYQRCSLHFAVSKLARRPHTRRRRRFLRIRGGSIPNIVSRTTDLARRCQIACFEAHGELGPGKRPSIGGPTGKQALDPVLVAELSDDHISGGQFRHGSRLIRWRTNKAPQGCRMDQIKAEGCGNNNRCEKHMPSRVRGRPAGGVAGRRCARLTPQSAPMAAKRKQSAARSK